MYLEFYGLREKPFSQTPDPRFLYWNDGYREALASLSYGIRERKGFLTMIGEAGTGKTTLLRKLLDDLGNEVVSVLLFNPNATFEEILEYTLSELGIAVPSGRKLAMLQRLNEFLLAAFAEGRNTILLIDEAQDLESDVLESLRLLSNLETAQEKILQIVLSGQPELAGRLAEPGLRQLKQRIAVRCRLEPLQRAELGQYVAARLAVAGGSPELFTPDTLDPIWSFAEGIPRLVNMVCDNALLVGYAVGRRQIDRSVIDEVVLDLRRLDVDFGGVSGSTARPSEARPEPLPRSAAAEVEPPAASLAPTPPPAAAAAPPPASQGVGPTPGAPGSIPLAGLPPAPARPERVVPSPRTTTSQGRPRWIGGALAALFLVGLGAVLGGLAQGTWGLPGGLSWRTAAGDEVSAETVARDGVSKESDAPLAATSGQPARSAPAPEEEARVGDESLPPPEPRRAPREGGEPPLGEDAGGSASLAPPHGGMPEESAPGATLESRSDVPPSQEAPVVDVPEPAPADEAEVGGAVAGREPEIGASRAGGGPTDAEAAPPEPGPAGPPAPAGGADTEAVTDPPTAAAAAVEPRAAEVSEGRSPRTRIQVQLGDTLINLAARAYGRTNLTTLDMLRERNPGISDIDLILEGAELEFPDPGPPARLLQRDGGVSVLALTTPALVEALSLQESLEARYHLPVDIEPTELGRRRDLYRVSIRAEDGRRQALEIAGRLGSILEDPGS